MECCGEFCSVTGLKRAIGTVVLFSPRDVSLVTEAGFFDVVVVVCFINKEFLSELYVWSLEKKKGRVPLYLCSAPPLY